MNFLIRPDAEKLLAEDDYKRLWRFFSDISTPPNAGGWLTDAVKSQYRDVWEHGLTGPLNFYRASPLRPGPDVANLVIPRELLYVNLRTLVVWGMGDMALLPGLLVGLADFVPRMELERVDGASHWIIHEQPMLVTQHLARFLSG